MGMYFVFELLIKILLFKFKKLFENIHCCILFIYFPITVRYRTKGEVQAHIVGTEKIQKDFWRKNSQSSSLLHRSNFLGTCFSNA